MGLANEFAQLTEHLHTSSFSPEQADLIKAFLGEISNRLEEADNNFHHRRIIIDFLRVHIGLSWKSREAIAKVIFTFGEVVLIINHNQKGIIQRQNALLPTHEYQVMTEAGIVETQVAN